MQYTSRLQTRVINYVLQLNNRLYARNEYFEKRTMNALIFSRNGLNCQCIQPR